MAPSDKPAADFSKECRLDDGGIQNDKKDHQAEDVQTVAPISLSPVITGVAVGIYWSSESPLSHEPKEIESPFPTVWPQTYTL